MIENAAVEALLRRANAYHVIIAQAMDSVNLAVLWGQIYYWSDKTEDAEGWIHKTADEIYEETGLPRRKLDTARLIGEKIGVIETKLAGSPPTTHYRVNVDRTIEVIEQYLKKAGAVEPKKRGRPIKQENTIEWARAVPDADAQELAQKFGVSVEIVRSVAEDLVSYCGASGRRYSNYKMALRNFVKSHLERHPELRRAKAVKEPTQELLQSVAQERTPEEQRIINEKLADVRKTLVDKMSARKF